MEYKEDKWTELCEVVNKKGSILNSVDDFKKLSTPLHIRCNCGHEWYNTYNNIIKLGQWCKKCSIKELLLSKRKKSWNKAKSVIDKSEKGELLTSLNDYLIQKSTKIKVKCLNGHTWEVNISRIVNSRSWCPRCAHNGATKEEMIERIKLAINNKGVLLSNSLEYKNQKTKLRFKCICGHEWFNSYNSIVIKKAWCPKCSPISSKEEVWDRLLKVVSLKHGKLLSDKSAHQNSHSKVNIECNCGFKFFTTINKIVGTQKSWCPSCAGRVKQTLWQKVIDSIKEKGSVVSSFDDYKTTKSRLIWRCNKGHEWSATIDNIKCGYWCMECHKPKTENKVRLVFETFFNKKFPSSKLLWNRAYEQKHPNILPVEHTLLKIKPKIHKTLELDLYCDELKIAVEYQGYQHYELSHHSKQITKKIRNYARTNFNDLMKAKNCEKNGVKLYVIPEFDYKHKKDFNLFIDLITEILKKQGLHMEFNNLQLEEMRKRF